MPADMTAPPVPSTRRVTEPNVTETNKLPPELLSGLFRTPDLYVADIDFKKSLSFCYRMNRDAYSRSAFLDHRTVPARERPIALPLAVITKQFRQDRPPRRPAGFIAHTALCGSTLLSRCLDVPGVCLPFREPHVIHRLSFARRIQPGFETAFSDPSLLELQLALLTRTYSESEKPVVKLTDTCINLCPDLLDYHEDSRVLLLYHRLPRFLTAMLRDDKRRAYARGMLDRAKLDLVAAGKLTPVDPRSLTDGRCAAYVWIGLMYPYLSLLERYPGRARSLDAEVFFAHPRETLESISRFFGTGLTASQIDHQLSSGILDRHAKDAQRVFDDVDYESEIESTAARLGDEIEDAVEWASSVTADDPIPPSLPHPLAQSP